jgi:hypothetical protein
MDSYGVQSFEAPTIFFFFMLFRTLSRCIAPPSTQFIQNTIEGICIWCELIFHNYRLANNNISLDKSIHFQFFQFGRKHFSRDAIDQSLKFIEPLGTPPSNRQ